MEIKTSELEGSALDWVVAKIMGLNTSIIEMPSGPYIGIKGRTNDGFPTPCSPSTDWGRGGPLIDKYAMLVEHDSVPGETAECVACAAYAWKRDGSHACAFGGNALVAICRAVVWLELGDTVDVPEQLL